MLRGAICTQGAHIEYTGNIRNTDEIICMLRHTYLEKKIYAHYFYFRFSLYTGCSLNIVFFRRF